MKTRQTKCSFALAHPEVKSKPYGFPQACIHNKPHGVSKEDCINVVWFSQCGPTAQRFQWPAQDFRKNFKFEICWKARGYFCFIELLPL